MLLMGELKCLHCGAVAGRWVGPQGAPPLASGLRPRKEQADPAALVRCSRCSGPVYLDDAAPVMSSHRLRRVRRLREQIAALETRPGRAA